ncbi:alpha-mannosidase [Lactococcus cremoris]|uniref:alpha-mannosidase n=1 Tax=Lactococcus lactis subsp. cremoris TaxID=1359 RepID=UPI00223AE691|nr:alpha-mannosidase [Lactococcus cremoris]MCT0455107.1 alpha-mannosidase [Lactococcus cremoris]
MKKKTVHIISHSHWDREWYMAYEEHHMRLVNLVDDLLDLFEKDPDFDSFHLDGQTIILDDYLQVRPERREEVQAVISAGKLRIGPFYILQDDFLISSESNVRNMLVGRKESERWGAPVELGYFPDTFGNMGQTPQMMKGAGLNAAAFGRGVKPIGFDNQVLEQSEEAYSSQFSEMWWEGPDGTKILGILFANWYSNGNEIPAEKAAALDFWNQKLADVEKFASTSHLLMMNGVDHQPVQKDLSQAIRLANELFPDYEFVHSNWPNYLEAVRSDFPENLSTVTGELTSQETDGWYTLANTASSRVYLKQWNTKVERQLENITEPLASLAYRVTGDYPHDKLTYAWKTLMQNHPHDSICGCSVDEVHREMMTRFEKANEVGKYLANDALFELAKVIDFEGEHPFVVFNTAGHSKTGEAEIEVVLERKFFKDGIPEKLYDELKGKPKATYKVINREGQEIPAEISEEEVLFDYDLPKDRFRVPYMKRFVKVKLFLLEMSPLSWETYDLVLTDSSVIKNESMISGQTIENDRLKLTVNHNGSLSIFDKSLNKVFKDLLVFEDTGDIGNEYIYFQPKNTQAILSTDSQAEFSIITDRAEIAEVQIKQVLMIPESADDLLDEEQKKVLEFRYRHAGRSDKLLPLEVNTKITVRKDSKKVDFETSIDNQMKDHRLRVLFPAGLTAETHEADSIYEVVTRPNQMPETWENPTNPQHQQAFVNLHNEEYGLTIGNFGLNEYEVTDSANIALTLLRGVGELGDWGYFPTPEAQTLGQHTFNYSLEFHGQPCERYETYQHAYVAQVPFSTVELTDSSVKKLPSAGKILEIDNDKFAITALKRRESDNGLVLRGYNMSGQPLNLHLEEETRILNLLEDEMKEADMQKEIAAHEIRTLLIKEKNQ